MPEISRFYGIVIQIFCGDHLPPPFHALYGGKIAKIDIENLRVIDGSLPRRALELILDWASMHRAELRVAFNRAAASQVPGKIDPLE